MNCCVFSGNIARVGDLKETSGGKKYIKFTVAVDRKLEKGKADFVGMTAFDKRAEYVSNWCTKGTKIIAECRFQQGSYTDQSGKTAYTHDFLVDSVEKVSASTPSTESAKDDYNFVNVTADGLEDEGLPFM